MAAKEREIIDGDVAKRQHPQLIRHPDLKPGQWRFDPEFGRKHNPTTYAEEVGYGDKRKYRRGRK